MFLHHWGEPEQALYNHWGEPEQALYNRWVSLSKLYTTTGVSLSKLYTTTGVSPSKLYTSKMWVLLPNPPAQLSIMQHWSCSVLDVHKWLVSKLLFNRLHELAILIEVTHRTHTCTNYYFSNCPNLVKLIFLSPYKVITLVHSKCNCYEVFQLNCLLQDSPTGSLPFLLTSSSHGAATLLHSFIASQLHCFTASQLHSFTASQLHSFTASLLHSITASQLHSFTASQLHSFTASQLHSFTASQLHSFTASLLHCFTKSAWCPPRSGSPTVPGFPGLSRVRFLCSGVPG